MLKRILLIAFALALLAPSPALAGKARISRDGRTAVAPRDAPKKVKKVIRAANRLVHKSYCRGGGHYVSSRGWDQSCYSCSGSVSYALHGGGFVPKAYDSRQYRTWALAGRGKWITIYAKDGHAYLEVAGLRFDTQPRYPEKGEHGPRWRRTKWYRSDFVARHPTGY